MEKTATLNLRVNPTVKQRAEEVLSKLGVPMSTAVDIYLRQIYITGGIPFMLSLHNAPEEFNIASMTDTELNEKLQKGYDDIAKGRTHNAREILEARRKNHR